MTWTKLSDDFSDDCWRLSDAAWRLHIGRRDLAVAVHRRTTGEEVS